METIMIVVLAIMLIIALVILIDTIDRNKSLNILIKDFESLLHKLKNENGKLKSKNENLKIAIDEQEARFNKHLKKTFDYGESKSTELETKYKSSLIKINDRDEKIRLLNSEIIKLEETKKEYSQRVYNLQTQRDLSKHEAIDKANEAVNLCNEMANKLIDLNLQLASIESELKSKLSS
jgi:chromosome segregation ATPase